MSKRKHSVGWFSSYDRGLDVLLSDAVWPKIVEAVPDVTLDVAYGWNTFDSFHKDNPERMKWKWNLIRKFNQYDVVEHGRLSHTELAELMKEIEVLAYCTSFPEIDCITVKKALAAGIDVVSSGFAALQESIWCKEEEDIEDIHDNPEKLDEFANRVIDALLNPISDEKRKEIAEETIKRYDWALIA
ncbi:MAG: glycosyltransferase family 1 protein, partial [Caulobacteraceae bacterium]|nr:glycosyltransferase family 1 protein [Caulobacteraceae bacterium]